MSPFHVLRLPTTSELPIYRLFVFTAYASNEMNRDLQIGISAQCVNTPQQCARSLQVLPKIRRPMPTARIASGRVCMLQLAAMSYGRVAPTRIAGVVQTPVHQPAVIPSSVGQQASSSPSAPLWPIRPVPPNAVREALRVVGWCSRCLAAIVRGLGNRRPLARAVASIPIVENDWLRIADRNSRRLQRRVALLATPSMLPLELLVVGSSAVVSHAIQIPIHRRSLSRAYPVDVSTYCDWGTDPFAFTSLEGMAYTGTIQVGGASFSVQLDTGSSDLWLDTANATLSNLTSTGRNASIIYESLTGAAGPIDVGNVTWGEFMFPQAFINAPGSNATGEGEIDGVLGLGPPYSSSIRTELETSRHDGSSFITNLFKHYPDVPNFLTFLLGRSSAGESDGGVFTIGELLTELEAIIDEPALPALTNWAWVTLVDAVIINGARYSGGAFPGSIGKLLGNSRQTAAVLDTGTSTSTAPPQYVDAMYKHLPGARFDSKNRRYYVPCDTKLNISIVFAGSHLYPMHPLDVINPDHVENGSLMCTGSFEYEANYTGIDFLLGDSFMRNVYSLFEFGSWTKPGAAEPHMKLPTGLCSQLCATLQP